MKVNERKEEMVGVGNEATESPEVKRVVVRRRRSSRREGGVGVVDLAVCVC